VWTNSGDMTRLGMSFLTVLAAGALASPALAQAPAHTVLPGESLWAIARANGISVAQLASANGRGEEGILPIGASLQLSSPSVVGGAAAAGQGLAAPAGVPAPPPPQGLGGNGRLDPSTLIAIHSPLGYATLAPSAARNWEALRQESLRTLGIDLYPQGPMSGYRTYEQQVELWRLYVSGVGRLAAPPGTSAHGVGRAVDLASPEMRRAIDTLGSRFGWAKTEAPQEWAHVNYVGP
jgi:N-acetylmuramoyl-L-alanine amidase